MRTHALRLDCTRCEAYRRYERRDDDPATVARCAECGKRHSRESIDMVKLREVVG